MRRIIGLSVLMLCLFCLSARGDIVYTQPCSNPPISGFFSDVSAGAGQYVMDDFTLAFSENVTEVHWWGNVDGNPSGVPVNPPPTNNFTIVFWNLSGGLPSSIITSITAGNVVPIPTGNTADFGNKPPVNYYAYTLTTPVVLTGGPGVEYGLEIYNHTASGYNAWRWDYAKPGLPGDNEWWLIYVGVLNTWTVETGHDYAFTLTEGFGGNNHSDAPIPEPFTCLLFGGSVLLGLGRFRRRLS
jgi:hypothetical protein